MARRKGGASRSAGRSPAPIDDDVSAWVCFLRRLSEADERDADAGDPGAWAQFLKRLGAALHDPERED